MSAKEYFQRDAERETFYRTFYQICRRFNVTWSTATPEVRAFIEEATRVTYEQEKAKRNGILTPNMTKVVMPTGAINKTQILTKQYNYFTDEID